MRGGGGVWRECCGEAYKEGFGGGGLVEGSGLDHSRCHSTCVFIVALLLVYLMSHPPPSRSQYPVLFWVTNAVITTYHPL